jgi:hypothetical protein
VLPLLAALVLALPVAPHAAEDAAAALQGTALPAPRTCAA